MVGLSTRARVRVKQLSGGERHLAGPGAGAGAAGPTSRRPGWMPRAGAAPATSYGSCGTHRGGGAAHHALPEDVEALADRLAIMQMPGVGGVTVATSLRAEPPGCRTMILTGHGRPGHLKRALAAGVRGLAPKTVSAQRLAEIIRTVHAGNRCVDPELAADAIAAGDLPLTAREAEVLELAVDGAPFAEIAERAAVSPGTAGSYLSSAVSKLGAENRHVAVRLGHKRGWV